jgi:hypothetical protein
MTAHKTRLVCQKNVLILALVPFVAPEPCAGQRLIQLFAIVHLGCKEMSMWLALKSNAPQMMIVLPMRNVTIQEEGKGKNVCLCVLILSVPLEQFVHQAITGRNVHVDHL